MKDVTEGGRRQKRTWEGRRGIEEREGRRGRRVRRKVKKKRRRSTFHGTIGRSGVRDQERRDGMKNCFVVVTFVYRIVK